MGWALLLYEPPCAFGLLSGGRAEIDSCWRGAEGHPPPASLCKAMSAIVVGCGDHRRALARDDVGDRENKTVYYRASVDGPGP